MIKSLLDWSAVLTGAGVVLKALPAIAALWTIVWLSISIWESKTVRGWLKRGNVPQVPKVDGTGTQPYVGDDEHGEGT